MPLKTWQLGLSIIATSAIFGCSPSAPGAGQSNSTTASAAVGDGQTASALQTTKPVSQTASAEPADSVSAEGSDSANNGEGVALIPRRQFFGNPRRARARISPDGSKLAFLAPLEGVLNVWVAPRDDVSAAKAVTQDKHRGIRNFFWAYTNDHILYLNDKDGDEDFHVYSIDLKTDEVKDLTPLEKISAQIDGVSEKFPEDILVGINDREPHQLHDLYRINIVSGERELLQNNPGFAGFVSDDDYRVRFASTYTPQGGQVYLEPDKDQWKPFMEIGSGDVMTTGLAGFDKSATKVYLLDSRDRNTGALKLMDLDSGETQMIAENDRADISGVIVHPTEKNVQAVTFTFARREWKVLDDSIQGDLDYLKSVEDGEVQITSRTLDDRIWTVAYVMDNGPVRFYLYDRNNKSTEFLFTSDPELEKLPLVKMHPVVIKSRDGLDLVCYYSLPRESDPDGDGTPNAPQGMVLDVHGGPWARDAWGYNPLHQLLANRGYAVLAVNYRGSTGFGKEFINAANGEWAGKMHDDLMDAVNWAIDKKIADKDRIAIMGGSYGGYATLVGLTFTPEVFACGVDIVGPSNLVTLLQNPPPYWMPFMPVMKNRVGDHETEEGREFLTSRSPLSFVDRIKRPLLIAQGAKDPRVKQAEADQIVEAMSAKNIPVTYMLYPEEGHGFARPENRFAFYAVAEAFLAEHLGGRYEPIGDAFDGAVVEIPNGKGQVRGLSEHLDSAAGE